MQVHRDISSLRQALSSARRVAFAPTMGNLHAGHASLMQQAHTHGDCVVASIFVNRLQFGPAEDFDKYPRTFEADCECLRNAGVHHLFAPDERTLYPVPQNYFVDVAKDHDSILEGASRPGHFRGVATVVTKLFNIVQPNVALFGKKDYQQLMVIRSLVEQLCMPIEIVGCETIRAEDGLALSSRNGYLSAKARLEAPRLHAALSRIAAAARIGQRSPAQLAALESAAIDDLQSAGWSVDYISVRKRIDLAPPAEHEANTPLVVVAAARLEGTRLIDNMEI